MRVGSIIILHLWLSYENPSSSHCMMLYFWWGCRGNLKLINLGKWKDSTFYESNRLNIDVQDWKKKEADASISIVGQSCQLTLMCTHRLWNEGMCYRNSRRFAEAPSTVVRMVWEFRLDFYCRRSQPCGSFWSERSGRIRLYQRQLHWCEFQRKQLQPESIPKSLGSKLTLK